MLISADELDLDNVSPLEKILLCQKVGQFLRGSHADDERMVVEAIAQMLAVDINESVREKLAFELRNCTQLDPDIAEIIARDIQQVAQPFLAETIVFSDEHLARLVPELQKFAHVTLAKRKDLGEQAVFALVSFAGDEAVTYVIRNSDIAIPGSGIGKIIDRFSAQRSMMNYLSQRGDIPLNLLDRLAGLIADAYRTAMISHYKMDAQLAGKLTSNAKFDSVWDKVIQATDTQIHGYALDLHHDGKLTPSLICDIGERGSYAFIVSAFSVISGRTRAEVKGIMSLYNPKDFVGLLRECHFGDEYGPVMLKLVKKYNGKK